MYATADDDDEEKDATDDGKADSPATDGGACIAGAPARARMHAPATAAARVPPVVVCTECSGAGPVVVVVVVVVATAECAGRAAEKKEVTVAAEAEGARIIPLVETERTAGRKPQLPFMAALFMAPSFMATPFMATQWEAPGNGFVLGTTPFAPERGKAVGGAEVLARKAAYVALDGSATGFAGPDGNIGQAPTEVVAWSGAFL